MEQAAITVHDLCMLARCEPGSWEPLSIFERLIPRREIYLKRSIVHASDLHVFTRAHADDGGVAHVFRERARGPQRGFDISLGAKDMAPVCVVQRPLLDLSAHVARTLRRFLENFPSRFSQIDFARLRMSKLMAVLMRGHVKDYLGENAAAIAEGGGPDGSGGGGGDDRTETSSQRSAATGVHAALAHALNSAGGAQMQQAHNAASAGGSGASASSSAHSISTSVARAITGQTPAIRFGPPIEILSASPLSIHLLPYGRNAFFPELMERRRQLEQQMQVDPAAWRSVILPPKIVAAVLRFFVVILSVPAKVVLQRLAEVLPAAVRMHYELSAAAAAAAASGGAAGAEEEQEAVAAAVAALPGGGRLNRPGGVVLPTAQANSAMLASANAAAEDNEQAEQRAKQQGRDPAARFPAPAECGIGIRYYQRTMDAATAVVLRAHMLTPDALLILHYTPHPVFGDKHESPLVKAARAVATRQGMAILEKVDVLQQQELLQILGILAKRHPHVYVCFEEVNATGGTLSADIRLVLTRVANNKFTLLVDGTFAVANPCAAPTKHWLNSARNAPGTACGDAYMLGTGAFLPAACGRCAVVVYSATKSVLDVEQMLEDPLLPLLVDDAVVLHHEMTRVMGAAEIAAETTRAADGIAADAQKQLAGTVSTVRTGVVCIPLPHIGKQRETMLGRAARRSINAPVMLEAGMALSLEKAGVTCCFARVNLAPVPLQNAAGTAAALAESVGAEQTETASVLCAVMFPHLQTIEQVPWRTVWRALSGQRIEHPDLVPTLTGPLGADAMAERQRQREKELAEERRKAQLSSEAAARAKQDAEDKEMLGMIRDMMGTMALAAGEDAGGAPIESDDLDLQSRDPYSYCARLDNLLARYDPMRAGSARAILDGMLAEAAEDFYGFRYDPAGSAAGGAGGSAASTILRKDVLEAIHLGRLVLRYGREPSDNSFYLVTRVVRDYLPEQLDKLPVLMEAYAAGQHGGGAGGGSRDRHLLDQLVDKFVPPHRRGLYRARQMYLRAPLSPEADVALARRLVHKCLASHRPHRVDEVSSVAHLLAPLATLMRHGSANPLQLQRLLADNKERQASVTAGGAAQQRVRHEFYTSGLMERGNSPGGSGGGAGAAEFLREEDTAGKLVRSVLENEIGIVPRVLGIAVGGGGSGGHISPRSLGGATPAVNALLQRSGGGGSPSPTRGPSVSMMAMMTAAADETNGGGLDIPGTTNVSRSGSPGTMSTFGGGGGSSPFLSRLFGGADDSRIMQPQTHNFNFHGERPRRGLHPPGAHDDFDSDEDAGIGGGGGANSSNARRAVLESRSASLAMAAAAAAEAYQDRQQEREALLRQGALADPVVGHLPQRLHHMPPDAKERVIRIYARYEPAKLHAVDRLMAQWLGQEEILIQSLCAKYGPEPPYDAPIRSFTRQAHHANPELERPGTMLSAMRGYYGAMQGPAARSAIDEAVDTMYPPEQTLERINQKILDSLREEMQVDV